MNSIFFLSGIGPATYNDGKSEKLVGVISGISEIENGKCGDPAEYTLAVSVYSHKDWIAKIMSKVMSKIIS